LPNCCASRASFFGCRARQHFPCLGARARARVGDANQRPWPADKVERWAIDRLIPYAKNARTHTDAQVAAIAASIKEWGWTSPALVGEDGGLIAGHARVLAARQLGIGEIPVMVAAGWSEAQKRAYVLADNQLAITGSGWDPELLRLELGELNLAGFDLSLTGFGDLELKDLLAERRRRRAAPDGPDVAPYRPPSTGELLSVGKHSTPRRAAPDGPGVAPYRPPSTGELLSVGKHSTPPLRRQHGRDRRRARSSAASSRT
jgi:hypothetical protein